MFYFYPSICYYNVGGQWEKITHPSSDEWTLLQEGQSQEWASDQGPADKCSGEYRTAVRIQTVLTGYSTQHWVGVLKLIQVSCQDTDNLHRVHHTAQGRCTKGQLCRIFDLEHMWPIDTDSVQWFYEAFDIFKGTRYTGLPFSQKPSCWRLTCSCWS